MSIEVKDIYKKFETKKSENLSVLENINLTIDDGELVCLLGPSGCGKTTLLRLIAGLDTPTSGEIVANGEVVKKPSGDRAVIFQQYSLFPWLTVLQNVTFGLEMTKPGSKEENIAAAERYLTSVGLIDFKDSYPHELSGGMKQQINRTVKARTKSAEQSATVRANVNVYGKRYGIQAGSQLTTRQINNHKQNND